MSAEIERIEAEAERLISGLKECDRLDRAAGEHKPRMKIGEWISARMRAAAYRALQSKETR